jgi:23S rRNA (cytosine1962-C5)-methyltransferase
MAHSSTLRPSLIVADRWRDYQLIDTGDGMKQERWGAHTLVRPDPQILWPRHGKTPGARWEGWDGFYHRSQEGAANGSTGARCRSTGPSITIP